MANQVDISTQLIVFPNDQSSRYLNCHFDPFVSRMARAGADVVGINCHFDPFVTIEGLRKMKQVPQNLTGMGGGGGILNFENIFFLSPPFDKFWSWAIEERIFRKNLQRVFLKDATNLRYNFNISNQDIGINSSAHCRFDTKISLIPTTHFAEKIVGFASFETDPYSSGLLVSLSIVCYFKVLL